MLLLILFAAGSLLAGDEPTGAKELFGGGLDRTVVQYSGESAREKPPEQVKTRRHAQPKRPFGLSCWIELVETPGSKGTQVVYTRTFKSGEKIRLHFRGNADGFISLVQLGASGTASVLFPDAGRNLADNTIHAGADQVLPSEKHWFRFDDTPGVERLLVLFARTREELDKFIRDQSMDIKATAAMLQVADRVSGSKDLVIETVDAEATYAVNRVGDLVVMNLSLVHQ